MLSTESSAEVGSNPFNVGNQPQSSFWSDLRFDIPASIAVALVALPLCLGIAIASGAPLMSGLISGIIGGIVVGSLSGSQTSVSGPAAGLTAVVLSAISTFGGSFEIFLVAVVLAGIIQILLGIFRAGFIAAYFPAAVIRGLLAAIGLILIFKQIPHAFGIDTDPEGDFSFFQPDKENTFSELLNLLSNVNPGALTISIVCLAIIIGWDNTRLKKLPLPSSLIAVLIGIGLNMLYMRLSPQWTLGESHLVTLPIPNLAKPQEILAFPALSQLFSKHTPHLLFVALELAIIASLETLLNIEAVDKLDPKKRHSPPDRELLSQGIGNVCAGFLGGLPVTSVIVRSSMNVASGGVSKKSTILHGILLIVSVALIPRFLNMIPLASLAAILLYTGYKLASFGIFKEFWKRGSSQFLPFATTVVAILFSDLLIGIAIGMAVGFFFILRSSSRTPLRLEEEKHAAGNLFRLKFSQQVTFLNKASLLNTLTKVPRGSKIVFDASSTNYLDPDVLQVVTTFCEEEAPVRDIKVSLVGFDGDFFLRDHVEYVDVLTQETQRQLTPERVLELLKEGNERFARGDRRHVDLLRQVSLTSLTQHPMAAVLSCIDSRTTSELIFDLGLGDIFSVRVAGNVVNEDVLGSLEYATKVAGAKLIVVIGHTRCGAVNAACDHVQLGNVTGLLEKIRTAVAREDITADDRNSGNPSFVLNVTKLNVLYSIEQTLEHSSTIRDMVDRGELAIVGAIYDISSGKVDFFSHPSIADLLHADG